MNRRILSTLSALGLLCLAAAVSGRDIREHRVDLSGGQAVLQGVLEGYDVIDYILALAPETPIAVSLRTDHLANYFNLMAPGSTGEAFFIGSTQGNRFEGTMAGAGDYTVRVYLMRSAARRNERAHYRLEVAIGNAPGNYADGAAGGPDWWEVANLSPGASVNLRAGPSTSSRVLMQFSSGAVLRNLGCRQTFGERWCEVARPDAPSERGFIHGAYLREASQPPAHGDATVGDTGYHAVGTVRCGAASCRFGVVRSGGGTAVVTIDGPHGQRVIHFVAGKPLKLEGRGAFDWSRSGDMTDITIEGRETFHIPDAVLFGG